MTNHLHSVCYIRLHSNGKINSPPACILEEYSRSIHWYKKIPLYDYHDKWSISLGLPIFTLGILTLIMFEMIINSIQEEGNLARLTRVCFYSSLSACLSLQPRSKPDIAFRQPRRLNITTHQQESFSWLAGILLGDARYQTGSSLICSSVAAICSRHGHVFFWRIAL